MKIKNLFLLALAGLMTLAFTGTAASASAQSPDYSVGTMDSSKKCSVTLFEYIYNDGVTAASYGIPGSQVPEGALPVSGIGCRYLKVADPVQKMKGNTTGLYFTNLNETYLALFAENGITLSGEDFDGQLYYTAASISEAQENLNRLAEPEVRNLAGAEGTAMLPTGNDGKTSAENLGQGIYLIAETVFPENIGSPSSPFLLTLPMTNLTSLQFGGEEYLPGTLWQYDVSVYPKNQTIAINKKIELLQNDESGNAGYAEKDDRSIGDVIRFLVTSDVPKLADGHLNKKYIIKDTMDAGLTYKDNLQLSLGQVSKAASDLVRDTDYAVALSGTDGREVTVTLTEAGLAKLDNISSASHLFLTYDALLNKAAVIAENGNANKPSLVFSTDRTQDSLIEGNTVKIFTYHLELTKTFTPETSGYSEVSFSVKSNNKNLQFALETDGVYHVKDGTEAADLLTETVRPNAQSGVLLIKGLDSGSYLLTEETTAKGYYLLANSVPVEIKEANMQMTVDNKKEIDLVHTGGSGNAEIIGIAGLLVAASVLVWLLKKMVRE